MKNNVRVVHERRDQLSDDTIRVLRYRNFQFGQ